MFLTAAGRAPRRQSASLDQSLLARSGLSLEESQALNRQPQSLRAALIEAPDQTRVAA